MVRRLHRKERKHYILMGSQDLDKVEGRRNAGEKNGVLPSYTYRALLATMASRWLFK